MDGGRTWAGGRPLSWLRLNERHRRRIYPWSQRPVSTQHPQRYEHRWRACGLVCLNHSIPIQGRPCFIHGNRSRRSIHCLTSDEIKKNGRHVTDRLFRHIENMGKKNKRKRYDLFQLHTAYWKKLARKHEKWGLSWLKWSWHLIL